MPSQGGTVVFGHYRGMLLQFELDHMRQYLDLVQQALSREQADFEAHVNDLIKDMPPEEQDEVSEMHADDYQVLARVLPTHLYASFIVTWYSFMETELFVICDRLYKERGLPQRHRDLPWRDLGTRRAGRYLKEVAKVQLVDEHWRELSFVNKTRNQIVHNGRVFDETPTSALLRYLEAHQLVTDYVDRGDRQRLSPNLEYCRHLIGFGRDLFTNLFYDAGWTADRARFTMKKRTP